MNRRELLMGLVGFESAPRYRELLYKLLSEDLEFPPPGFILELDRFEWSFLKDEIQWVTQAASQAAVAAQQGFLQIFNPVGSGRLVTVRDYAVFRTTAGSVTQALTTTIRGASGSTFPAAVDTRWNTPITPTGALVGRDALSATIGTAAAFGSDVPIGFLGATAASWQLLNFPKVTLAPGTGVVLSDTTVNEVFGAWFAGYSRQARPEELVP